MRASSSVTAKSFVPGSSRRHLDPRTVRNQFEDWLAQVADDMDIARAERLATLFERSPFTRQKDLADAIGVETRTVQRWLAGEGIAKRNWTELADALDTTVRFLVFGEEEPKVDASQLDRIEEKLDRLLAMLEGEDIPAGFEEAADRTDAQQASSGARPPRKRGTRKAS